MTLACLLVESGGGVKGRGLVVPSSRGSKGRFRCIRAEGESRGRERPPPTALSHPHPRKAESARIPYLISQGHDISPGAWGPRGGRGKVLHVDQHPPRPPPPHPGPHGAGGGCRIPEGSSESPGVAAEKTSGGRTGRRSLGLS